LVNYNDDFNQPRTIEQTITIDVMEMMIEPIPEEGMNGEGGLPVDVPTGGEETFWQKVLRFLRGLIGLDSGTPTTPVIEPGMDEIPVEPGNDRPAQPPLKG